jgi:hypothetical protein
VQAAIEREGTNGSGHAAHAVRHAPAELTSMRLKRIGEGIGKVVYASPHWVVKRERSPFEIVALIWVWKLVRRVEHMLPEPIGRRLLAKPSLQIRALRVMMQGAMAVLPKGLWFTNHVRTTLATYRSRDRRGETLAREYLAGTDLVPETVTFPPVRTRVSGWPGWLVVSEATERVETTLYHRLHELAARGDFAGFEKWLDRLLDLRQNGWQRGIFSLDAHLKNFGVVGDRVVLLDPGGLTNRWEEIEKHLEREEAIRQPHVRLGLEPLLRKHPEIAERFNARWREVVNLTRVRGHWPAENPPADRTPA